jgi:hypothetical protein
MDMDVNKYSVLDGEEVVNIIAIRDQDLKDFIASSGLSVRPYVEGDEIVRPQSDKTSIDDALAILDETLTATTVTALRAQVDSQLSRFAEAMRQVV